LGEVAYVGTNNRPKFIGRRGTRRQCGRWGGTGVGMVVGCGDVTNDNTTTTAVTRRCVMPNR